MPHDFYPDDQRRLMAYPLPDGRYRCVPPFCDEATGTERDVVSLSLAELIDAGYETDGGAL